jgi:nuclear cap-binding protein subunit 1
MRRAVESEVRLAYHDRILKTLPEAMRTPDAQVIAEQSPGPEFDFDHPGLSFFSSPSPITSPLLITTTIL